MHCKLAATSRQSGALKLLLRHMFSTEPSFIRWSRLLPYLIEGEDREIDKQLCDTKVEGTFHNTLNRPEAVLFSKLNVCCVFDLEEHIETVLGVPAHGEIDMNMVHQSLQVAAKYGRDAILTRLLTRHWPNVTIPQI
jgi:hypothetical protein